MTINELIARLEASEGSRELDYYIWRSYVLHPVEVADPTQTPYYTTSIDAKLPWENIISVQAGDDYLWRAFHYDENGGHAGNAKTEAIARRIAALKARIKG